MNTFERIYTVVRQIPFGRVATYGTVAALAGNPHWSQVVGWALHANPRPEEIPCHRVVNRSGGLAPGFAFGGPDAQRTLLESESVVFLPDGRVNMDVCRWPN